MKKRFISLVLCALIIVSSLGGAIFVFANEIDWSYDTATKTLTVTGIGKMDDYDENTIQNLPWYSVKDQIEYIVIGYGVTHVGDYTFCRQSALKGVTIPNSVTSIGTAAFAGIDGFKEITIPASVDTVGDYAFGYAFDMSVVADFVCYCSFNSAAQLYCLQNYVAFDVSMAKDGAKAECLGKNWQSMWSFTPTSDGVITWYSTGNADTYGLIYDSENYTYSETFSTMKASALKYNADSGDNLNFKIELQLEADKTYYLAAKYESAAKTSGTFDVAYSFQCTNHGYKPVSFDGKTVGLNCSMCQASAQMLIDDYLNSDNAVLDVYKDDVINVKDYAVLYKNYYVTADNDVEYGN